MVVSPNMSFKHCSRIEFLHPMPATTEKTTTSTRNFEGHFFFLLFLGRSIMFKSQIKNGFLKGFFAPSILDWGGKQAVESERNSPTKTLGPNEKCAKNSCRLSFPPTKSQLARVIGWVGRWPFGQKALCQLLPSDILITHLTPEKVT